MPFNPHDCGVTAADHAALERIRPLWETKPIRRISSTADLATLARVPANVLTPTWKCRTVEAQRIQQVAAERTAARARDRAQREADRQARAHDRARRATQAAERAAARRNPGGFREWASRIHADIDTAVVLHLSLHGPATTTQLHTALGYATGTLRLSAARLGDKIDIRAEQRGSQLHKVWHLR